MAMFNSYVCLPEGICLVVSTPLKNMSSSVEPANKHMGVFEVIGAKSYVAFLGKFYSTTFFGVPQLSWITYNKSTSHAWWRSGEVMIFHQTLWYYKCR